MRGARDHRGRRAEAAPGHHQVHALAAPHAAARRRRRWPSRPGRRSRPRWRRARPGRAPRTARRWPRRAPRAATATRRRPWCSPGGAAAVRRSGGRSGRARRASGPVAAGVPRTRSTTRIPVVTAAPRAAAVRARATVCRASSIWASWKRTAPSMASDAQPRRQPVHGRRRQGPRPGHRPAVGPDPREHVVERHPGPDVGALAPPPVTGSRKGTGRTRCGASRSSSRPRSVSASWTSANSRCSR